MENYFSNAPVSEVMLTLLGKGEHTVRLKEFRLIDSFTQYNGSPKEWDEGAEPAWANACDQLGYQVVNAEIGENGKELPGTRTDRLNAFAFLKEKDVPESDKAKYTMIGGWACYTDKKTQKLMRELDPANSVVCENIQAQFAKALDIEVSDEKGSFIAGLEKAIAEKTPFRITVSESVYQGEAQFRITRFRKAVAVPDEASFAE